jgi:hypothetical protein
MDKRNKMPLIALIALAGLGFTSQDKAVSREEAIRLAKEFLLKVKLPTGKPLVEAEARGTEIWSVEFGSSNFDRTRVFLDQKTGHVRYASTTREAQRHQGLGRNKKRRFSHAEEAKLYTNTLLKRFIGDGKFELDEFRFSSDKVVNGTVVPGEVWARYGRRVNGYPIVDRSCYIAFKLDSQDGYLLSYSAPPNVPKVSTSRTVRVSKSSAWNTLLKNTGNRLKAVRYDTTLGYAVPEGETTARLCWRMWEKGKPPYAYFVDAESGKYLGRLGH